MAKTMALMEDTVGLTLTETLESLVHGGGVIVPNDGVIVLGLKLSVVKDI
ncbi:unnamed protein product, partial [Adineta steineri]